MISIGLESPVHRMRASSTSEISCTVVATNTNVALDIYGMKLLLNIFYKEYTKAGDFMTEIVKCVKFGAMILLFSSLFFFFFYFFALLTRQSAALSPATQHVID